MPPVPQKARESCQPPPLRIFISAPTHLGEIRQDLSFYLQRAKCLVVTQEILINAPTPLLEKLDEYVRACDLIIHIVGEDLGSVAHHSTVKSYLEGEKDFLAKHPELLLQIGDLFSLTYTQWEALLGIHHNKPVLPYYFESAPARHLEWLKLGLPQRHGSKVRDKADLYGQLFGDLEDRILAALSRPGLALPIHSNIPGSIRTNFLGRDAFLADLHHQFALSGNSGAAPQAIHGLGGIGKTRIAIEYAHRYASHYPIRLLIRADCPSTLHLNFANLGAPGLLDLPQHHVSDDEVRTNAVHRYLDDHPGWLLILDNVDTEAAAKAVETLIPKLTSGHVLITSRLGNWSSQIADRSVEFLSEADAAAFLKERTANARGRAPSEDEDVRALAQKLDGLALALEQAAAFITVRKLSFSGYLQYFNRHQKALLEWHHERLMQYPASVAITWLTTFEQLSPAARELLDTLCHLAPDPIPATLLASSPEAFDLETAQAELSSFSLIRFPDPAHTTFAIHRLVQEIVRDRAASASGTQRAQLHAATLLAHAAPPKGHDIKNWPKWQRFAPHCNQILESLSPSDDSALFAKLLVEYAGYLANRMGDYSKAEALYRRAWAARKSKLGRHHPDTLSCAADLAQILTVLARYKEATRLSSRTWEARKRLLGHHHEDTLTSANSHGQIFYNKGDFASALPIFEETLKARERTLPADHEDILVTASDLGMTYRDLGRHQEAEVLLRRALDGNKRKFGERHPTTLTNLNNFALLLEDLERYDESQPLREQDLAETTLLYGPSHPDTLTSRHNRGHLHQCKKQYAEAHSHYTFAFQERKAQLGHDHQLTLLTEHKLATLHRDQNRFGEAIEIYDRILPIARSRLEKDSADILLYQRQLEFCREQLKTHSTAPSGSPHLPLPSNGSGDDDGDTDDAAAPIAADEETLPTP